MTRAVLGIDVSKATLDVCLELGPRSKRGTFNNDTKGHHALYGWVRKACKDQLPHVCLEATGQYGDRVAKYLYEQGCPVSMMNPMRIKAHAGAMGKRNKTDKADAEVITDFCLKQNPPLWSPPPSHLRDLKALVRRLDDLKNMRTQEKNRLGSGTETPGVIASIEAHIDFLEEEIKDMDAQVQALVDQFAQLKKQRALLESIPGIGKLSAAVVLAEIPDIANFESARQVAAYVGVTPRNHRSGSSVHPNARLSKTGNAHLRHALYFPAVVAKNHNPIVREFCQRLTDRGKAPKAVVCAAMRKLLHIAYGVLKSGQPFDPEYLKKQAVQA